MSVTNNMITRFRGDNYPLIVTLKENGNPVDLTNATVRLSIGFDTVIVLTAIITDAVNGVAKFEFPVHSVDKVGRFPYDIEVNDGGYITTYVKDIFELIDDVTKL